MGASFLWERLPRFLSCTHEEELAPMGRSYEGRKIKSSRPWGAPTGVGLVSKPCGPSQVANTTIGDYGLPCWHHCPAWGCRI